MRRSAGGWYRQNLSLYGLSPGHARLAPFLADGQQTIIDELERLAVTIAVPGLAEPFGFSAAYGLHRQWEFKILVNQGLLHRQCNNGYLLSVPVQRQLRTHLLCYHGSFVCLLLNLADYPSRQLEHLLLVKDTIIPDEEVRRFS